ncbi:MAG: TonB-dependent receptor [Vicinamibacterales bacterium]
MRMLSFSTLAPAAAVLAVLLSPHVAVAQSVTGQVTDETGAVLPGVTIEAASAALIEKVRSAVSDGSGRYEIAALKPGTYTVTFKLAGFKSFARENLRLTADQTTSISARLEVGQLEETVTVTGATPVVDITQAGRREVLDRQVLDELPTSRTTHAAGAIIPGLKMTGAMVGGQGNTATQQYLVTRGKGLAQNTTMVDGMITQTTGGGFQAYDNYGMAQEVAVETNAISAEVPGSGVRINVIPREGGNKFNGEVSVSALNSAWQKNNLTPELLAGGTTPMGRRQPVRTPDGTRYAYDVNPSVGGPIVANRLWYFSSGRINRAQLAPAGATYFERNPTTGVLAPGTKPGYNDTAVDNISLRVTWQVNGEHKLAVYRDQYFRYQSHLGGNATQDWATVPTVYVRGTQYLLPVKWTMVATNRLLFEAGVQRSGYAQPNATAQPGVEKEPFTAEWYAGASRLDAATGRTTVGPAAERRVQDNPKSYVYGAASFVTGSHSLKMGVQATDTQVVQSGRNINASLQQRYINGVPNAVNILAVPYETRNESGDFAAFVQERWTIKRLTANIGVRMEKVWASIAASDSDPGRFIGARSVPRQELHSYTNAMPRFSVAYDLFGNGKTAVKASLGQFMQTAPNFGASLVAGSSAEVRNWFDCALLPGTSTCDPARASLLTNRDNIAQDIEIPASTNPSFGYVQSLASNGKLKREHSWDSSVSVQHELLPGVAVTGVWYRTHESNIAISLPVGIAVSDYSPFTMPNPLTPSDTITVFNLKPGFATGRNIVRMTENYRTYNGMEVSLSARLPGGGILMGGWFADKKVQNACDTDNPNNFRFCDTSGKTLQEYGKVPALPLLHEFKLSGSQRLKWGFQASFSIASAPGNGTGSGGLLSDPNQRWQQVQYAVPANLFPGGRTVPVNVPLLFPNQRRLARWNSVDMKISHTATIGRVKLNPQLDLFNLTNSSIVTAETLSYSDALRLVEAPTTVLPGRMMRLGLLVKF